MEDYKEGDARASKMLHDFPQHPGAGRQSPRRTAGTRHPGAAPDSTSSATRGRRREGTAPAIVRHIRKSSERDWAAYLESAIRSAGLTQAELARRSGLAESMVSRWLRGLNQPDVPNLRRVRPVLGVPMLELLVAAGHVTLEEAQLRDAPEPPVPVRIGIGVDGLTPDQVRQVEGYAAFLRAQNASAARSEELVMHDSGEPLRYAAYGGARLTRDQEDRVREKARRAREEAARTGQPVVFLDDPGDSEE